LEITLRVLVRIVAIVAFMLGGAEAMTAAELPTFERDGYSITPHQLQVLEPDGIQEQARISPFTLDGMPATPHQLSVLRRDNPPTHWGCKATAWRFGPAPLYRKITKWKPYSV
jgi:hypothetical protein